MNHTEFARIFGTPKIYTPSILEVQCPVDDGSLHSLFIFRGFKGDILYQCEHDCALESILEKRAIDVSSFVKPTDFPKHLVALQRKTIEEGLRRPVKNAEVPQDGGEERTGL